MTTEHCQICEREIKSKLGLIAHHGYTRPESGWQTDSCMGARKYSYEKSRDIIPKAINYLKIQIKNIELNMETITNENLNIPYFRIKGGVPFTHSQYNRIKDEYFSLEKHKITKINFEIERLQKRYDNWKIQTEVKLEA